MARLELDVVQTGSGNAVKDAARQTEELYQAQKRVEQAQLDQEAALRKVEIQQLKVNDAAKKYAAGSPQLLAAQDKLETAHGRVNRANDKVAASTGNLAKLQQQAADSAKNHADQSGKATSRVGQLAKGVAGVATAFGAAGIVDQIAGKIADFGAGSVTAASDLQQSSGAAAAVFGKDYAQIAASADKAATAVGLSSAEYQQMAAVTGAGLKNQGLADYTGKTQKLIGLGADLAAQFGGSTQDAVEAIGSLMRGETDPIEKYGVSISESAVSAELAARGQSKLTGEALKQAQAQAKIDLLLRQTTSSQGAFARESDTLAGAQQRVGAQVQNLQAKIGTALLPALSGVTSYMSQTMDGGTGLSKVLGILGDTVSKYVTPIVTKVQEGIGLLREHLDKATGSSANTEAMFSKVGAVIGTIASVTGNFIGGSLKALLDGFGYLVEYTSKGVDWLDRMSSKLMGIELPAGLGTIRDVVTTIEGKIESVVSWLGKLGEGSGPLASVAALFRSDLSPAGAGTGWSRVPLIVPAPITNVAVNVDGAALRGIIRAEIRATLPRGGNVR